MDESTKSIPGTMHFSSKVASKELQRPENAWILRHFQRAALMREQREQDAEE
jgi:hypothetical protein